MKRLAVFCIIIIFTVIICGLCQTAVEPDDFTGQWYSSGDQSSYLFREGLIYCPEHAITLSDTASLSGAYSYCRSSIILFAAGIDGLETEKELYLVHNGDCSFLCENKNGTGEVYFIRYHK